MNNFLSSPAGRMCVGALCVLGVVAIVLSIRSNLGPNEALSDANNPWFINAETGYTFHHALTAGMEYPVKCPDTGKTTGYTAELCYWTKDGHVKKDPTPVLLNKDKGKSEPTFCPDCGRLVRFHNPLAVEGHSPPPTESEYMARQAQAGN